MNRIFICLRVALLAFAVTGIARAQVAAPTPTPDPLVYTDPAMTFKAPDGSVSLGRNPIDVDKLSDDLQTIAAWVYRPGHDDAREIQLQMESFEGPTDQWEGAFESQMHSGEGEGVLIRGKTPMTLLNGMPAYFVEITSGEGFSSQKEYAIVWVDGQRGIVLSVTARVGDIGEDEAKSELHDVTAVRYPTDQP